MSCQLVIYALYIFLSKKILQCFIAFAVWIGQRWAWFDRGGGHV